MSTPGSVLRNQDPPFPPPPPPKKGPRFLLMTRRQGKIGKGATPPGGGEGRGGVWTRIILITPPFVRNYGHFLIKDGGRV